MNPPTAHFTGHFANALPNQDSKHIDAAGCLAASGGMGQLFERLASERHEEIRIDFAGMHQLDSMALGRLMLLRSRAHANGTHRIVLDNVRKDIAKVFGSHEFRKLFVLA